MKTPFVQPRFEGKRFNESTLPLEIVQDLVAYENLIIKLAKHLYKQEHPDKERAPKGFTNEFNLHLDKIEPGSAKPLLVCLASTIPLIGDANPYFHYFVKAREITAQCIEAPDQLPKEFPKELLVHFNQIGRSLREDERMTLEVGEGRTAKLTPDLRKKLVLAAEKEYQKEIELYGSIGEADWEKSTFRIRMADDATAIIPMPKDYYELARIYGGKPRHQVMVKGVGSFDSWDRLQKVIQVDSMDILPDYQIANRIETLQKLADGWLDGQGKAPDKERLSVLNEMLVGHYPEILPLPIIAPTPEGNIVLEWDLSCAPSLDISLDTFSGDFHAINYDSSDIEKTYNLNTDEAWKDFFAFLEELMELKHQ